MIIPIGTDNPLRRTPYVNYALLIINVALFIATRHFVTGQASPQQLNLFHSYMLNPQTPQLHQFLTYAFLHGSWMHVIGNMLFLYIFGNNVNDRLGHIGYSLLYLGGAVFSGLGHVAVSNSPVLGASGAVAAVTGTYMVLFPKTYIHVLYVIIFIGTTSIPALYFILFKLIVWDNILGPQFSGPAAIAYSAHLAGYAFGIVIPLAMIALKLLPHSQFDLWALLQRWHRRRQFTSTVHQGYDPYGPSARIRKIDAKVTDITDEQSQKIAQARSAVSNAVYASDLAAAADKYLQLLQLDPQQVLPEQQQLDIANKLMHTARHPQAAHAYETFIEHYPRYPFLEQIQLMLGLLYSRYLDQHDLAQKHLADALPKLSDPGQKKMCQDEIHRLSNLSP